MSQLVALDLNDTWSIGGKLHGGYVLACLAREALQAAPFAERHPDPLSVSAHFFSAPDPGPAQLELVPLREGRQVSALRARLVQETERGELARCELLLTAGRLPERTEPEWREPDDRPPEMPTPDACPRAPSANPAGVKVGHLDHVDLRLDPATLGWAVGKPIGRGVLQGWLRPDDGLPLDVFWLLIAVDALPPVTFDLGISGWVPTLSLDVQLRQRPSGGWLAARQYARLVSDGWLDETCDLWDADGRLVASGRQLAGYRQRR